MDPTQKAFGVSLFLAQLMAMAFRAFFQSRLYADQDRPFLGFVTPQGNPDWENASRFNDLILDIKCRLHEGLGLQSYPKTRPDHFQVPSKHLA